MGGQEQVRGAHPWRCGRRWRARAQNRCPGSSGRQPGEPAARAKRAAASRTLLWPVRRRVATLRADPGQRRPACSLPVAPAQADACCWTSRPQAKPPSRMPRPAANNSPPPPSRLPLSGIATLARVRYGARHHVGASRSGLPVAVRGQRDPGVPCEAPRRAHSPLSLSNTRPCSFPNFQRSTSSAGAMQRRSASRRRGGSSALGASGFLAAAGRGVVLCVLWRCVRAAHPARCSWRWRGRRRTAGCAGPG
jgi:hypothetical protein